MLTTLTTSIWRTSAAASTTLAWSAASAKVSTPASPGLAVGTSELLGLGGSLLLVVGAVVVVGWLYSRSQGLRGVASDVINVVAAQALGPKERIILVEVGGKQIVLGMTAQQVQTLHVFDEPVATSNQVEPVGSAFAKRLRSAIRGAAK